MIKKSNIFYFTLFLSLTTLTFFITSFGALFAWIADDVLIICLGLVNAFVSSLFYYPRFLKCLVIGFIISSLGLITTYILCFIFLGQVFNSYDALFAIGFYGLIQTLFWKIIGFNDFIFKNIRSTILSVVSLCLFLIIAFNAKYYWKLENFYKMNDPTLVYLKIQNSKTNMPYNEAKVSIRTERQPFFGNMISTELVEKTADSIGMISFHLYKDNKYSGSIWKKNGSFDFFEIHPEELNQNDTIIIKN